MNTKLAKKLAVVGAALVASLAITNVPTAASAAPACAGTAIVQCVGVTSDGAKYVMQVPANFNGTAFLYSHGYRYEMALPSLGYPAVVTDPQPGPFPMTNTSDLTVMKYLLSKGYAIFGSGFAKQGWNADSGVATDVELIKEFKTKFTTTKHVVAWGESLGGFITQALAEKHPELIDAAAPMCMAAGSVEAELTMAGDFLWGLKTFFDPSIKGGNYASDTEALVDLGKVVALLTKLQTGIGKELVTGQPQWPDTTPATITGSALASVPTRSVLLMLGLMSGISTQSNTFDGTTGPGSPNSSTYTSFALAASPALAVLENGANAAVLGVLVTRDVEKQSGGAIFDNTKTDYASRVASESSVFSAALSGATATNGMLGYLKVAPRATGNAAAIAKMRALVSHTGKINVPTFTLAATADPVTPAGNSQWIAEKYAAQYEAAKAANIKAGKPRGLPQLASIWVVPPTHYSTFDGSTPVKPKVQTNGTGHCYFTAKQYIGVADLLASAATDGMPKPGTVANTVRKMKGAIIDAEFKPSLLKFYVND
mgnify:CR=1 FL=1